MDRNQSFSIAGEVTLKDLFLHAKRPEIVEYVLQFAAGGGDIGLVETPDGWTLLRTACEHMNYELIAALGRCGVDANATSGVDGWTAMHHAVDIDIDSIWQALQPADLASRVTFDTVRHVAAIGGRFDVLDRDSATPRDLAASYGEAVAVKLDAVIRELESGGDTQGDDPGT